MGRVKLTEEIKKETIKRLEDHVSKKYIGTYGVEDIKTKWKGRYLYIDWIEKSGDEEIKSMISAMKKEKKVNEEELELLNRLIGRMNKDDVKKRTSKLCRIHFTGNPKKWDFELYKYSDNWYDKEGEFPFSSGTVEECFDAAASLYITQTFP
ncbi:MAG TPA: hypothetical protein VKP59_00305 [Candidatus Thermoplasmatota archaeon]|nr:hypothetical protein [Candidatus Thermoplasmatota archaeon]